MSCPYFCDSKQLSKIPKEWKDPVLQTSPSFYMSVCVPLRILIGFWLLGTSLWSGSSVDSIWFQKTMIQGTAIFAFFIVCFFSYKQYRNPCSWKNYTRVFIIYTIIFCLCLFCLFPSILFSKHCPYRSILQYSALLIWMDVIIGQQSWYQTQRIGTTILDLQTNPSLRKKKV